jgi:ribA/ribD-fused uncharacterized protein
MEHKDYELNKAKSLNKKLDATKRQSVKCNLVGGNLVITCNAGVFEVLKHHLLEYYNGFKSYDGLKAKLIKCEDNASSVPEVKVKVTYPSGGTCYTVNVYNTTSKLMVNGKGLNRFQNRDFPVILSKIDLTDDKLNDKLRECILQSKDQNSASNSPRKCRSLSVDSLDSRVAVLEEGSSLPAIGTMSTMDPIHVPTNVCVDFPQSSTNENEILVEKMNDDKVQNARVSSISTCRSRSRSAKRSRSGSECELEESSSTPSVLCTPRVDQSGDARSTKSSTKRNAVDTGRKKPPDKLSMSSEKLKISKGNEQKCQTKITEADHQMATEKEKSGDLNTALEEIKKYTKSIHKLEDVLVNTLKNTFDEVNNSHNFVHAKEISLLRKENESYTEESTKLKKVNESLTIELETLRRKHTEDLQNHENKITNIHKESTPQVEKLRAEIEELRIAHKEEVKDGEKQFEYHCQEAKHLMNRSEKLNSDLEKQHDNRVKEIEILEDKLRQYREEIESRHDEIIILKGIIASLESNSDPFTTIDDSIKFKGEGHPFSNLFHVAAGLKIFTHTFYSGEAAYKYREALACNDFDIAEKIVNAHKDNGKDGWKAMELAEGLVKPEAWEQEKFGVMKEILELKRQCCPEFKEMLLKANNRKIVENTTHEFWGKGNSVCKGKNMLGKILMDLSKKENMGVEKQQVLIVGNSHTSQLKINVDEQVQIERQSAMTIQEAEEQIEKMEQGKYALIVLHEITNDVKSSDNAHEIAQEMIRVASVAKQKAEVLISLGIPTMDTHLNNLIKLVNLEIECNANDKQIKVCSNSNLLFKGKTANKRFFSIDGFHLTKEGQEMFERNLLKGIYNALELSSPKQAQASTSNNSSISGVTKAPTSYQSSRNSNSNMRTEATPAWAGKSGTNSQWNSWNSKENSSNSHTKGYNGYTNSQNDKACGNQGADRYGQNMHNPRYQNTTWDSQGWNKDRGYNHSHWNESSKYSDGVYYQK